VDSRQLDNLHIQAAVRLGLESSEVEAILADAGIAPASANFNQCWSVLEAHRVNPQPLVLKDEAALLEWAKDKAGVEMVALSPEQVSALQSGQYLVLDVNMGEYAMVLNVKKEE